LTVAEVRNSSRDQPRVRRFGSRRAMGEAAAADIAAELRARLGRQAGVRMIFAAAPSQSDALEALVAAPGIDWHRVTAFHMDEYIGLPPRSPARFANWLEARVFSRLPFAAVHLIRPEPDARAVAAAYAAALAEATIDIVCLGIGVNGHIAFNDPPVADFNDPLDVKLVDLDEVCRQQQVDDEGFTRLADVPLQAVTLTVPRLLRAERLYCVVPGAAKRQAVRLALEGPIAESCPASILRTHQACTLYLDRESDPHA